MIGEPTPEAQVGNIEYPNVSTEALRLLEDSGTAKERLSYLVFQQEMVPYFAPKIFPPSLKRYYPYGQDRSGDTYYNITSGKIKTVESNRVTTFTGEETKGGVVWIRSGEPKIESLATSYPGWLYIAQKGEDISDEMIHRQGLSAVATKDGELVLPEVTTTKLVVADAKKLGDFLRTRKLFEPDNPTGIVYEQGLGWLLVRSALDQIVSSRSYDELGVNTQAILTDKIRSEMLARLSKSTTRIGLQITDEPTIAIYSPQSVVDGVRSNAEFAQQLVEQIAYGQTLQDELKDIPADDTEWRETITKRFNERWMQYSLHLSGPGGPTNYGRVEDIVLKYSSAVANHWTTLEAKVLELSRERELLKI